MPWCRNAEDAPNDSEYVCRRPARCLIKPCAYCFLCQAHQVAPAGQPGCWLASVPCRLRYASFTCHAMTVNAVIARLHKQPGQACRRIGLSRMHVRSATAWMTCVPSVKASIAHLWRSPCLDWTVGTFTSCRGQKASAKPLPSAAALVDAPPGGSHTSRGRPVSCSHHFC